MEWSIGGNGRGCGGLRVLKVLFALLLVVGASLCLQQTAFSSEGTPNAVEADKTPVRIGVLAPLTGVPARVWSTGSGILETVPPAMIRTRPSPAPSPATTP